jgi:AraC-like DNA-binding protein
MMSEPGEVHLTTGVDSPGTFTSVFIANEYLHTQFEGDLRGHAHFTAAQVAVCAGWQRLASQLATLALGPAMAGIAGVAPEQLMDELILGVGSLLARAGQRAPRVARSCTTRLQRAHDAIVDNYRSSPTQRLPIEELAKELGVSRYWLTHSFTKRFGYSPSELHTLQRVARVRSLLSTDGKSLSAAAAEAGYCDHPQMSREFRRHWGITPKRYQAAISV